MRVALALLLGLVCSACLKSDLVQCGDVVCPPGASCVNGAQCATADQLAACDGIAEGAECMLNGANGLCESNVCTLARCGDGVIEPGEGCDGSVPADITCSYFGYYRGEVTCSNTCQLLPSSCAGRCGDGVTDLDQGEYCDGALPASASCLDFGYDLGTLACGQSCGPNLAACHHLTWQAAVPEQGTVTSLWGGSGWLGVVFGSGDAAAVIGSTLVTAPSSGYQQVAGSTTAIWAAGQAVLARWTPSGGWVAVTPPWASSVTGLWVSDALGLFVATSSDAALWHYDGAAWSQITGPWTAGASFGRASSTLYVIWYEGGSLVATWDGTKATPFFVPDPYDSSIPPNTIGNIVEDEQGRVWVDCVYEGVIYLDGGTWSGVINELSGRSITQSAIAAVPGGVAIGQVSNTPPAEVAMLAVIGRSPKAVSYDGGLIASDGASIFFGEMYGVRSALQTLYGDWTVDGSAGTYPVVTDYIAGGPIVMSSWYQSFEELQPDGTWAMLPLTCDRLAISAAGHEYCALGTTLTDGANDVAIGSIAALWAAADDSAAATVGDHVFAWRGTGGWTIDAPPVAFSELGGLAANNLYAIGVGDGHSDPQLWHYDGTWHAVTSDEAGLANLVVTPDAVFALSGGQLVTYVAATGTISVTGDPGSLSALTGSGVDSDLFALGGETGLLHFDGTTWSPVTAPTFIVFFHAFGDQLVVLTAGYHDTVLQRLARWHTW